MIIAGTGHRPNKLGGYGVEATEKLVRLAYRWLHERHDDTEMVISGGALGWDQALATASFLLGVPFTLALPFNGFHKKWPTSSQVYLEKLIDQCEELIYVEAAGYAPWKMQKRNEWMVDHADTVLALWDGTSGGTGNCIAYANKVGKPIVNLWRQYANQIPT